MADLHRDPCPVRIVQDCGISFLLGQLCSGIFHSIKGFRDSPSGVNNRLIGMLKSVRSSSPAMAGRFGFAGFMFATSECSLEHMRGKDDMWNVVGSGFMAGAAFAARSGPVAMLGSSVACGIFVSLLMGAATIGEKLNARKEHVKFTAMIEQMQRGEMPQAQI